jgi:hypothetical protein
MSTIVEVLLTACLLTSIETCEEHKSIFGPFDGYQLSQEDCENNGLVMAKNFLENQQGWAVTGWTCKQKAPAE